MWSSSTLSTPSARRSTRDKLSVFWVVPKHARSMTWRKQQVYSCLVLIYTRADILVYISTGPIKYSNLVRWSLRTFHTNSATFLSNFSANSSSVFAELPTGSSVAETDSDSTVPQSRVKLASLKNNKAPPRFANITQSCSSTPVGNRIHEKAYLL